MGSLTDEAALAISAIQWAFLAEDVKNRGSDHDKLIICLPEIAAAMARRARDDGRKKDAIGLEKLSAFFEKWLSGLPTPVSSNPEEYIKFMQKIEPGMVDLNWVLEFPRAKEIYDEWIKLDGAPGTVLSPAAGQILGKRLCENGLLDPSQDEITFDFTSYAPEKFEDFYFNHVIVPEIEYDDLDDQKMEGLFAALGAFTLAILGKGRAQNLGNGAWKIFVEHVCVYVRDRFNFETDKWWQILFEKVEPLLRYWNCEEKAFSKEKKDGYVGLSNSDFRNFRNKFARGGDFFVLSEPVCIEVREPAGYEYACAKK